MAAHALCWRLGWSFQHPEMLQFSHLWQHGIVVDEEGWEWHEGNHAGSQECVGQTIHMMMWFKIICVPYFLIWQSTCLLGKRNAYRTINSLHCSGIGNDFSGSCIPVLWATYRTDIGQAWDRHASQEHKWIVLGRSSSNSYNKINWDPLCCISWYHHGSSWCITPTITDTFYHAAAGTVLVIKDLAVLSQKLTTIAYQWYPLGIQLEFDPGTLKGIQNEVRGDTARGLDELLTKWLQRSQPPATFESLVDVVGGSVICNQVLAEQLKHECSDFPSIKGNKT